MLLSKKSDYLDEVTTEPESEDDPRDKFIFYGILALTFTGALNLINLAFIAWLALKPPPTLVRDVQQGTAFRVKPANAERTPEEVLTFVSDRIHKMHTWTGTIPSAENAGLLERDPGISVSPRAGQTRKVTTAAYEASFALTESIRIPQLEAIAQLTPQAIFNNDPQKMGKGTYTLLNVRRWIGPEKMDDGRWKLTIIADINAFSPAFSQGKPVSKFNKDIYVSESPEVPLLYPSVAYQSLAYLNRVEGFEIDSIVDTQRGDLNVPR